MPLIGNRYHLYETGLHIKIASLESALQCRYNRTASAIANCNDPYDILLSAGIDMQVQFFTDDIFSITNIHRAFISWDAKSNPGKSYESFQ